MRTHRGAGEVATRGIIQKDDPVSAPPQPLILDHELTGDDYAQFNLYTYATAPVFTKPAAQSRAVGSIAVTAVLLALTITGGYDDLLGPAITALIGGTAYWFLAPLIIRASVRANVNRMTRADALGPVGPTRLWLDGHGVHQHVAGLGTSAQWSAISQVAETDTHGFVYIGPTAAFIVPKRTNPAGASAFLATVRACRPGL